jgi:hypothetical protein
MPRAKLSKQPSQVSGEIPSTNDQNSRHPAHCNLGVGNGLDMNSLGMDFENFDANEMDFSMGDGML